MKVALFNPMTTPTLTKPRLPPGYDGVELCPQSDEVSHYGARHRGGLEEEGQRAGKGVAVGDQGGGREGAQLAQDKKRLGRPLTHALQDWYMVNGRQIYQLLVVNNYKIWCTQYHYLHF